MLPFLRPVLVPVAFLVATLSLGSGTAHAQLLSYTITGTIDGFDYEDLNFGDFEPDGDPPFAGGVPYVLTFELDTTAPLTNSGSTFADYGQAVVNLFLDIDGGTSCAAGLLDSVLETYSGATQTWAPGAGAFGPGCVNGIPPWDVIDFNTFEQQTVAFEGFEAVLLRFDAGFYSTFPPPLIAPDLTDSQDAFIQLRFGSVSGGPNPAFMAINGTIDAISVPEPRGAILLAAGLMGLSALVARRSVRRA